MVILVVEVAGFIVAVGVNEVEFDVVDEILSAIRVQHTNSATCLGCSWCSPLFPISGRPMYVMLARPRT